MVATKDESTIEGGKLWGKSEYLCQLKHFYTVDFTLE